MQAAIKAQCSAAFKGLPRETIALPYVVEYNARSRLRKIGYVSDFSKLYTDKANIFLKISEEYDRLEKEKMEREIRRGKKRS